MFAIETCINPPVLPDREPMMVRAQSSKRNCLRIVTSSLQKCKIKTVGEIKKSHKKNEHHPISIPFSKIVPQNCQEETQQNRWNKFSSARGTMNKIYLLAQPTSKHSIASTQPITEPEKNNSRNMNRQGSPINRLMNLPN